MKKNPYEKNVLKICSACDKNVMLDQYGNGECEHCGWYNCIMDNAQPNAVIFPNLVSLNKDKQLAKEGKTFSPTLDDFLEGFLFYGEMQFNHNGIEYELFRADNNGGIVFGCKDFTLNFISLEEFKAKAAIENKLLKDVWHEVKDANYI